MIPAHPTTRLTTPDKKLIQLDWSELENVFMDNTTGRIRYMVTIAGEEFEVTDLDWAQCFRVLGRTG